jgi:hypothetical protein
VSLANRAFNFMRVLFSAVTLWCFWLSTRELADNALAGAEMATRVLVVMMPSAAAYFTAEKWAETKGVSS